MRREELIELLNDIQPGPGQDVLFMIDNRTFDFTVHYDDWGTYLIPLRDNGKPLMPEDLEDPG